LDQKRRWESQQALKKGISIVEVDQEADITELWAVLEENLSRKHAAKPVHSLNDILLLKRLFPDEIQFMTAQDNGVMIAGFVLFSSKMVVHLQYSASSQAGYDCFALHPIVEKCVEMTRESGRRYFDFGISNEKDGRYLNTGLHAFKSKFGAGGALHEFYDLDFETALKAV
jgi:lipid II:glycine glycyltransferase (peptidoglycan interpeptide bridge formation enzyme)